MAKLRLVSIFLLAVFWAACWVRPAPAEESPSAAAIMARVATNQDSSEAAQPIYLSPAHFG
jgi:PBP1b-binding outer membrane lipoprotein LpoB